MPRHLIRCAAIVIAAAPFLCAVSAQAATVSVDCSGGPSDFSTITAALNSLNPSVPNTINVTGTCHESVVIRNFTSLTIQAPAGQTATLGPATTCGQLLTIQESHGVVLRRITIAGGQGLSLEHSGVKVTGDVVIEHSCWYGVTTGRGTFLEFTAPGPDHPNVIRNNHSLGVWVRLGSEVIFTGQNEIRNNGGGIGVHHLARVESNGTSSGGVLRVEDNSGYGVSVTGQAVADIFGGATIRNNGKGGVRATEDAHVALLSSSGGIPEVVDNGGPGIFADTQAKVILLGSRITGNTGEGVRLLYMSIAQSGQSPISPQPDPNAISGNGGADVSCDKTSMIYGNLSGIGVMKCSNAESDDKR